MYNFLQKLSTKLKSTVAHKKKEKCLLIQRKNNQRVLYNHYNVHGNDMTLPNFLNGCGAECRHSSDLISGTAVTFYFISSPCNPSVVLGWSGRNLQKILLVRREIILASFKRLPGRVIRNLYSRIDRSRFLPAALVL